MKILYIRNGYKTPDDELQKYQPLNRADGAIYLVHEDDMATFLALPDGKTEQMELRCLDGFTLGAIKMYDGTIYLPNCMYRGEEIRQPFYETTKKEYDEYENLLDLSEVIMKKANEE